MSVNRLLFEGSDDQAVVMNLLYNHQANGSPLEGLFQAKDKKGIANLLSVLPEELKATDLRNLGIVLNADSDPEARWANATRRVNSKSKKLSYKRQGRLHAGHGPKTEKNLPHLLIRIS